MPIRLTIDEAFAPSGARTARDGAPAARPGVELLDGRLVMRPLPTAVVVELVVRLATFLDAAAPGLDVEVGAPILSPPFDVLRPEVVVRRPLRARRAALAPDEVVLAVLVGDERDLARRARRCAAAPLLETWALCPELGTGTRLSAPRGGAYSERELLLPGEIVAPLAAPWLQVVPLAPQEARASPRRSASRSPS
jgi:hypothetical protein